jgi:hypothetical protein
VECASIPKTRFAQLGFTGSLSAGGIAALTTTFHGALLWTCFELSERRIMHMILGKIKSFESVNLGNFLGV